MPSFTTSTCRDRTAEFLQIAERLHQAGPSTSSAPETNGFAKKPSGGAGQFAPQSEFAQRAARIGMQIHSTTQKLQKLAQLAKRTSMFDDPAQDIAELTTVIKQDITTLNASISDLQGLSHQGWGEGNRQSSVHSETVVDNLRARLKDTTMEFKDVLTLRSENLKSYQDRRSLFSTEAKGLGSRPLLGRNPLRGGSTGLFGDVKGSLQAGDATGSSQLETQPLLQQQQQLVPAQDTYMASRAEALQNVEKTIHELGTIFQQLAEMVQQQAETVVRIDENVDETMANVDAAQTYLLKYLKNISSNRWLVLKVFFVLMIFLVIFLVFVA